MSDLKSTDPPVADVLQFPGVEPAPEPAPAAKPKIRWLRLIALLTGLSVLAAVSTVFGMMMAVASDLPALDVLDVAENPSKLYDRTRKVELGTLTGNERRILVNSGQIAPVMKHAIVAIEDRRFYSNSGVDIRGIGRALYQDVIARKAVQGGSTITQQLVKNRLDAQNDRTLFQKLREAAIAFHMTEKWDKQRILTNYLNTIYFGNGAYGIESAARTYFGYQYPRCGEKGERTCASQLEPHEAALLAGVVASPTGYDPIANPESAKDRRDLVLNRMLTQGYISRTMHDQAVLEPVPARADIKPPAEESRYPYFTTWVRQQVVDKMGAGPAFEGGLRVETTIDARMQEAAERAVEQMTAIPGAPAAALVAIDNSNSEVVAMIGGDDDAFNERPFNLATQGQRQPGSAFKPFTLIQALSERKAGPNSTFTSAQKHFCVTRRKGRCVEEFEVNNYEDNYSGVTTLANATAHSDNSVYAELGIETGLRDIAKLARRMGIRTPVSTNMAQTLGGLKQGVTVLDMAHAYQTIAQDGRLIYGDLSPDENADDNVVPGPVGIREIRQCQKAGDRGEGCKTHVAETRDGEKAVNRIEVDRVFSRSVARQAKDMLLGVTRFGTGKAANLGPKFPVYGKTGTTEDYGDAWFVGFTKEYTVAVWVGYPDAVKPMKPPLFSYQGKPVAGGTWPTVIWNSFMRAATDIYLSRLSAKEREKLLGPTGPTGPSATSPAPSTGTVTPEETGGEAAPEAPVQQEAPAAQPQQQQPQQQQQAAPEPEPEPQTAQPNATVAPEGGSAPPPD